MKKLNIVLLLIDANTIGGIQTHLMTLAAGMRTAGHQVTALLPDASMLDDMVAPLLAKGVAVERLPGIQTAALRLRHLTMLWSHFRRIRPDVLHIQQSIPGYDRKGIIAGWSARVPLIVVTEHDQPWAETGLGAFRRRLVDRFTGGIITVSQFSRRLQLQELGRGPSFVHTIYNGIDVAEFTPRQAGRQDFGIPVDVPVIGTMSRLEQHKGIDDLLQAAALLAEKWPGLQLLISGTGPARAELLALTKELGLQARVHFLGRYPDAPALLRRLDIFVLPSRWEAFGLVAAEAMAVGCPVVGTAVGGLPELIVDGETGFIVPSDAPQQLAQQIDWLLEDPLRRLAMGKAGRSRAAARFSAARTTRDTLNLYQDLLSSSRVGRFPGRKYIARKVARNLPDNQLW